MQVGVGLEGSISLRKPATEGLKLSGKGWKEGVGKEPVWLKNLPELKAEVSLNLQLSRASDIMAVVSNAPGLLALGSRELFMKSDWGSLPSWQREALVVLGWDQRTWDTKRLPNSARRPFDELYPEEMEAALQLPVPKEGHWMSFWEQFGSANL